MATNKTLTPTNVTIAIPAMADKPDASVLSNCVDKEADAINALNSNISDMVSSRNFTTTNAKVSHNFTVPSASRHFVIISTGTISDLFIGFVLTGSNGAVSITEISKGSGVTITSGTNTLTVSYASAKKCSVSIFTPLGKTISEQA